MVIPSEANEHKSYKIMCYIRTFRSNKSIKTLFCITSEVPRCKHFLVHARFLVSVDITVYAQKLSLSGAFTMAPMADTAIRLRGIHPNSDRQSSVVRMSACGGSSRGFAGGFAGRFRLPTQGGVIVGNPGDT